MPLNYRKIGWLITKVSEKNKDGLYDKVLGVAIEKEFMPSVANTIGTDLKKYNVVRKNRFAFNPMHVGRDEKLPIAVYHYDEPALVSPAYMMFEIKDKSVDVEYLMLIFKTASFDHLCWFHTDASVRGGLTWEDFTDIEINIPSLDEQLKIVRQYKTITDRIDLLRSIDEKLQDFAFIKYQELVEGIDKDTLLCEIADITMGTSPSGDTLNEKKDGIVFYQGKTDFDFRYPEIRCFTTDPKKKAKAFDILMSVRAPVGDVNIAKCDCAIGRGIAAIRSKAGHNSFLYYTMLELYFELNRFNDEGTVFGSINKDDLFNLQVAVPDESLIATFDEKVSKIDEQIKINEFEISQLNNVLNNIMKEILS